MNLKQKKIRLDELLVQKELAESRNAAKSLIMAGMISVDGKKTDKAGTQVSIESIIEVKGKACPYVSRGGLKLEGALDYCGVALTGVTALDIGASTGGFTDCLLQHGAKLIYAVDVGHGQLHWKLRNDARVINIEKVNARNIGPDIIPVMVDVITIDVSFISIKKIIPQAINLLKQDGVIIALIKPQFEVGKGEVGKGGIVKSPEKHRALLFDMADFLLKSGLHIKTIIASPIKGQDGNIEFFAVAAKERPQVAADISEMIEKSVGV